MSLHLVTPAEPGADTGVVDFASARPRRSTRERLQALRRGTVERVTGGARAPMHAAIAVERDYAITVRTPSLATARHTVEAIGRMIPAVVSAGHHRCRIEAVAQAETPMTIMVESAAGDPQTLDTVLRCLESIAGAPLRATVIIHEPNRTHVRTWAGTWVEPEPRGRRTGGAPDAPLAPAAA
jgi:hypothetical protein